MIVVPSTSFGLDRAFLADPGLSEIAFTFGNGFVSKGQKAEHVPSLDRFPGSRSPFSNPDGEFCSVVMLHEMAHFAASASLTIVDNGRGCSLIRNSRLSVISASQRDTYADSPIRTGSIAKPRYLKLAPRLASRSRVQSVTRELRVNTPLYQGWSGSVSYRVPEEAALGIDFERSRP